MKTLFSCRFFYCAALLIAIAPIILAAPCPLSTTVQQLQALGSCTMGANNEVTFTNFTTTISPNAVVTLTMNIGNVVGMTFSNAGVTGPYSVGYTAICNAACNIVGAHSSSTENPAGAGSYSWNVTGQSGGSGLNYNVAFAGLKNVTTSGTFNGGALNQSISLNLDISGTSATPEPTSFILLGSGFIALSLVSRHRAAKRSRS